MSITLPTRPETEKQHVSTSTPNVRRVEARKPLSSVSWLSGKKPVMIVLAVAVGVLAVTAMASMTSSLGKAEQALVYYTVARADLPINVTERGNLESQVKTEIVCEVENLGGDRSGNSGTQILFIVPNGKSVKEGELLVELDAAPLKDRLDNQVLATERARAEQIQANAKFENQKTQNETLEAEAELKKQLAELDLEMYDDGEDGTYQITLKELELDIQEKKNLIVEAQEALLMQATDLKGIEMLYKLGYRGKGDLKQAQVSHLKAQGGLVKSANALSNAISNKRKLESYEGRMKRLELEGAVATAERALAQVKVDNVSLLAQAEAAKIAADRAYDKEKERLDNYTAQLEKCKIHAPHDGMVVYANERGRWNRGGVISEGTYIRERQSILTLPDLSKMQVKTAVHESVLDQVKEGLPVTVRIDAFSDKVYPATVQSVGVLPDQGGWLSSDIKVYETLVTIDEDVERLKPGMTAVVEIHVDRLNAVLSVPVQAIVQVSGDNWCYVDAGGDVERRSITLGRTNDKFVEIREGLDAGDRVVLNPMAIVDDSRDRQKEISPDAGEPEPAPEALRKARAAASQQQSGESTSGGRQGQRQPGRRGGGHSQLQQRQA